MILTGSASGILCTSGGINYSGQDIELENGYGIGGVTIGEIRVTLQKVLITGTGIGVGINAAGNMALNIICISDTGNGTAIYIGDGGVINFGANSL